MLLRSTRPASTQRWIGLQARPPIPVSVLIATKLLPRSVKTMRVDLTVLLMAPRWPTPAISVSAIHGLLAIDACLLDICLCLLPLQTLDTPGNVMRHLLACYASTDSARMTVKHSNPSMSVRLKCLFGTWNIQHSIKVFRVKLWMWGPKINFYGDLC